MVAGAAEKVLRLQLLFFINSYKIVEKKKRKEKSMKVWQRGKEKKRNKYKSLQSLQMNLQHHLSFFLTKNSKTFHFLYSVALIIYFLFNYHFRRSLYCFFFSFFLKSKSDRIEKIRTFRKFFAFCGELKRKFDPSSIHH